MDAGVVAALLGAGASIVVAVMGLLRSKSAEAGAADSAKKLEELKSELSQREEIARRRLDTEEVISRYREPLASAAFDLQSRLRNILDKGFLTYLSGSKERREEALSSTLFRLAQYFGWAEALRQGIQFLDFNEPERSREVRKATGDVARLWATDKYGPDLMIWYEAQRAIGELMLVERDEFFSVIGFARFSREVDRFQPWLGEFKAALEDGHAQKSRRLLHLQHSLVELVRVLDPQEVRFSNHMDPAKGQSIR
jgi:hypothetical protein